MFDVTNTQGYSQSELDTLNKEWEGIVNDFELQLGSDDYYMYAKMFQNEVSKRNHKMEKDHA